MDNLLVRATTIFFMVLCKTFVVLVVGDIGTATSYAPPYLPNKCSVDADDLPVNGYFVAAGTEVWDNGAACGRRYQVRCVSGVRRPCKSGLVIVTVVDFCRLAHCPTFAFCDLAFKAITKGSLKQKINIEYNQI